MPAISYIPLVCLALAGSAVARVPGKADLVDYEHLWENSPICRKPLEKPSPAKEFLSEWRLGGVSEVEGGYLVTLAHRHHAGERLVIRPTGTDHCFSDRVEAMAPGTFRIERVQLSKDWGDLEVHLMARNERGILKFEKGALLPAATPLPAAHPARPPLKRIPVRN
jgi:hypothetical protein